MLLICGRPSNSQTIIGTLATMANCLTTATSIKEAKVHIMSMGISTIKARMSLWGVMFAKI
ncbi:MAG: hypothetical protein Cons2KO_30320 [Congregibacter sp.]